MGVDENSFDREYWEDRYAAPGLSWSGNPNPVLVTESAKLLPGRALDVGSGEGADTVWLAQQGWNVTGVDIAESALEKARAYAVASHPDAAARIDWQQRDITVWSPKPRSYDLVSAQFMHLPQSAMSALWRSLAAAVASGGTLLIVGHDASDHDASSHHRAHLREKMFSVEDVLSVIKDEGLRVEVAESRQRVTTTQGSDFLHDIVVMATRSAVEN